MKKALFLMLISIVSCTVLENGTFLSDGMQKEIIDEPYSFETITATNVWKQHNTFEEMQKACQIPHEYLENMTTRSLVETCIKYPLFGNYMAYNDQFDGVKAVMAGFNGFEELKSRDDAAEELLKYYASMDVEIIGAQTKSDAYSDLVKGNSVMHVDFMELVLMSGVFPSVIVDNSDELRNIAESKLLSKINNNTSFSDESILKTGVIIDVLDKVSEVVCKSSDYVIDTLYWFNEFKKNYYNGNVAPSGVYTKGGQYIEIINRGELTDADLLTRQQYLVRIYPNAIILSEASDMYNGHGYAWHMSDGGSECWINSVTMSEPDIMNGNIRKYWTNDYYWQTYAPEFAQKILYVSASASDCHTAVRSSVAGKYESKWGGLPLVRHEPNYCPYIGSKLYFTHNVTTGLLVCSSGNGETSVGESSDYYPAQEPSTSIAYREWEILTAKGTNAVEDGKASISTNGNVATISFNFPGLYQIFYRSYNSLNYLVGEYFFEPIVE
ncbi:MAG: hypothetical protein IKW65_02065 [Bacteroidales bacterium]|nr:hypothetical protein [Bacteroidales bacterium]